MRSFFVVLFALGAIFIASTSFAQGSASGYGQAGGGGGGFGGRTGGGRPQYDEDGAVQDRAAKTPGRANDINLWTNRDAILTPGDYVEVKVTVQKGEVLLATATSDAFDPALSLGDEHGKILVKNDDRSGEDQTPYILYRFDEPGTYSLRVISMRSISGGKFRLSYRTFVPAVAAIGVTTIDNPSPDLFRNERVFFRVSVKKGSIYDVRNFRALRPYTAEFSPLAIFGPVGVPDQEYEPIPVPSNGFVFRSLVDGDFYIECYGSAVQRMESNIREVILNPIGTDSKTSASFDSDELKVFEFPIAKNKIVRTTLTGDHFENLLSCPNGTGVVMQSDPAYGTNSRWSFYQINRSSNKDYLRVFHVDGVARLAIRNNRSEKANIDVVNSTSLPEWTADKDLSGTLGIGESKLYLVGSKKSELMKVVAAAKQFLIKLDIFRMDGTLANSLMNREALTASDDLYFPDADNFIIRISCDGYGGGGDFSLRRDSVATTAYNLATSGSITLTGKNFGLYAVNLEAGKRYELITEGNLRVDLIDDDGQFLRSTMVDFNPTFVNYFVPTRTGRHRLWLRGDPGTYRFKLAPFAPPVIPK